VFTVTLKRENYNTFHDWGMPVLLYFFCCTFIL